MKLEWSMAKTPTHVATTASIPIDHCVVIALRQKIELGARARLDRYQAYTLLSLATDLRITQAVNGSKCVHVMPEKLYLTRKWRDGARYAGLARATFRGRGLRLLISDRAEQP